MKWILSHATEGIHQWQLQQDGRVKFLSFHRQRLSLRIAGITKRLFFLNEQGFLQKKILLRSEYGVAIGETIFIDKPVAGHLTLNEQKFFYRCDEGQLSLFDSEKNLLAVSEFDAAMATDKYERYGLLFGFTWLQLADGVAEKNRVLSITA